MTLLIFQLTMFLLITDGLYAFLNFSLLRIYFLKLTLPFNIHHFVVLLLAFIHVFKSVIQIFFIISTILHWRGKSFFLTEKHLVKHQGIFSIQEKVYDLNNIRSVTIKQSFLGKIFHFRDVIIETSASGGYKNKILVAGIADPENFEAKLRHCF